MNGNAYEERLGTDRMLPLVFRMALPAVAAQIANLLYSIVDRIFIGHIPGIGTDALAGVGVTTSVIILISAFSSIVGGGGAPLAAIALGQGDRERAERILGNGFILLVSFTIPQNNSTPVGEKTFYVRIVSPEGTVLGQGRTFPFEGGNVVYTEKKTIEYDQQEVSLSVYHNVTSDLSKGSYLVEVFVDNYRLASRSFAMNR